MQQQQQQQAAAAAAAAEQPGQQQRQPPSRWAGLPHKRTEPLTAEHEEAREAQAAAAGEPLESWTRHNLADSGRVRGWRPPAGLGRRAGGALLVGRCWWWLLVAAGGALLAGRCWWRGAAGGGALLVAAGGCWWLLVAAGGCWWLLVAAGGALLGLGARRWWACWGVDPSAGAPGAQPGSPTPTPTQVDSHHQHGGPPYVFTHAPAASVDEARKLAEEVAPVGAGEFKVRCRGGGGGARLASGRPPRAARRRLRERRVKGRVGGSAALPSLPGSQQRQPGGPAHPPAPPASGQEEPRPPRQRRAQAHRRRPGAARHGAAHGVAAAGCRLDGAGHRAGGALRARRARRGPPPPAAPGPQGGLARVWAGERRWRLRLLAPPVRPRPARRAGRGGGGGAGRGGCLLAAARGGAGTHLRARPRCAAAAPPGVTPAPRPPPLRPHLRRSGPPPTCPAACASSSTWAGRTASPGRSTSTPATSWS
jgi:hypothetical protein